MKMNTEEVELFLLECRNKRLSPHTLKAYRLDLTQALHYFGTKEIDKQSLIRYIAYLNTRYQTKTIKRKLAVLHTFFEQQCYDEKMTQNPFRKVRYKLREEKRLPRVIETTDLRAIIQAVNQAQNIPYIDRDKAIIELLIGTGIRVTELCHLKREDVNFTERYIRVFGKGAKERIIYLGDKTLQALSVYYCQYEDKIKASACFFVNNRSQPISDQSVRKIVSQYTKHIEAHVTPHMFRHTFATLLLEQDVDISYIQKILGHSSITTTTIYAMASNHKQKEILLSKNPREWLEG